MTPEDKSLKARIELIKAKAREGADSDDYHEAATLAQSVLHDTVGDGHPLMSVLEAGIEKYHIAKITGACRTLVTLFDQGKLESPRLRIAREIEGDVLDIAEAQLRAAGAVSDPAQKDLRMAISAFLAGAAIEDSLRRLCDKNELSYDAQNSSISRLQSALYSPGKGVEVINGSENKQLTVWGDTRNKADHGKFSELKEVDVSMMIIGIRAFIARHLG
jgi:hypothetical protein